MEDFSDRDGVIAVGKKADAGDIFMVSISSFRIWIDLVEVGRVIDDSERCETTPLITRPPVVSTLVNWKSTGTTALGSTTIKPSCSHFSFYIPQFPTAFPSSTSSLLTPERSASSFPELAHLLEASCHGKREVVYPKQRSALLACWPSSR